MPSHSNNPCQDKHCHCDDNPCHENKCCKKYCCDVIIFNCYLTNDFNDDLYRYIKISTSIKTDGCFNGENNSILYIKPYTQKGYIGNLYIPVENIQNNTIYYSFNLYEDKININKNPSINDPPAYNYVTDRPIKLSHKCKYKLHINNQPLTYQT
jgi:hypothetical protein